MRDTGLDIGCHGTHSTALNDMKRPLWALANRVREQVVWTDAAVRGAIRRVHGPEDVQCGPHEMVVLCLVRDGAMWLDAFVDHYLALGARHIFFLDNDSGDDTVARASRYDRVSVFTTTLPFKHFELGLRRWLTKKLGHDRWSLAPDADELWDYPASDRLPLAGFLRYLRHHGYKAVTSHALDMFSDLPFSRLESRPGDDLKGKYRYYDISDVITTRDVYWIRNGQARSDVAFSTFGGVRERFFGSRCLCQTRHALLFADDTIAPYRFDGHFTANAPVADVTTVLLHYKFVGTIVEQARTNLEMGQHWGGSAHYRGIHEALSRNPDLCLRTESAAEFTDVQQLVDEGFLTVSEAYLRWVEEHGRGAAANAPGALVARSGSTGGAP